MKKILFVLLDGAADTVQESFKTSYQMAHKPNIDKLAKNGVAGLIENNLGDHPDSGHSIFTLLGYSMSEYPGRGYLDALGIGLPPRPNTVYIRGNFATVKEVSTQSREGIVPSVSKTQLPPELLVIDRRAGRDTSGLKELAMSIASMNLDGVRINLHKSVAHRCVVTMSSVDISPYVSNSDPEFDNQKVKEIKPLRTDNASARTAKALDKWSYETYKILRRREENKIRKLPANYILLREASTYKLIKSFKEKLGMSGSVVAVSPVVRGIAKAAEMNVVNVPGGTSDMRTDLAGKTLAALKELEKNDFVLLHILGTDIGGHDKNIERKKGFIEKIDKEVFGRILEYVDFSKTIVVATSDHITSVFTGSHESGEMPYFVYTKGIVPDEVQTLDEVECRKGESISIDEFMEKITQFR